MAELQRGVVKWFNDAKGYGFIVHSTGKDVFVHYSVIEDSGFKTLKDGEEVEYELKDGDKGLNAGRVLRVNAPKQDDAAATEGQTAPTLESGAVKSPSVTDMIEVVKEEEVAQGEDQVINDIAKSNIAIRDSVES